MKTRFACNINGVRDADFSHCLLPSFTVCVHQSAGPPTVTEAEQDRKFWRLTSCWGPWTSPGREIPAPCAEQATGMCVWGGAPLCEVHHVDVSGITPHTFQLLTHFLGPINSTVRAAGRNPPPPHLSFCRRWEAATNGYSLPSISTVVLPHRKHLENNNVTLLLTCPR